MSNNKEYNISPSSGKKREVIKFNTYDRFKPLLYADLFIPSWVNGYSIGMEYIYNWFLSKFPKDYFRTIHVSGKSAFDDFRRFNIGDLTKREKPTCIIEAQIQYDYNDNQLDLNYFGVDEYIKRSRWERSFFKDPKRGLYIGHDMEAMLINFTIKTRYDTRAQQLDAFNRERKMFRVGCTETIDLDMDIHLPYDLMVKVAKAAGFDCDNSTNESILDPWGFVQYLNAHSQLPILYKMRYINSKHEFFVRMKNLPVHLDLTNPLDVDDGESDGQLMTNFNVTMQVEMRLPVPKCFLFYNEGKIESSIEVEPEGGLNIYSMRVFDIPEVNYKGWVMYGHSNYIADDNEKVINTINIKELFMAPPNVDVGTSLNDLIEDSLNNFISPDSFIDVQVYTNDLAANHGGRVPIKMNWETRDIIMPENTINSYFYIAIYIDRLYVNNKVIDIDKANESRLKESRKRYEKVNYNEMYDTKPHIQIVKPYPTNLPKNNTKK